MGNIDEPSVCQECGEVDILDSTLKICFECWCVLDLKEQESRDDKAMAEDEFEQNPYDMG